EHGPRAAAVKASLRTERTAQVVFDGAVLDLGDNAGAVAIDEETREGQRVLVVDNGYLRFRLAPQFLGSVIALETVADGMNHLLAARVAVCNHTGATLPVQAALVAYLQPGGTVDGAELLLDVAGRRRLLRAQRSEEVSADGWVGVRNLRTGRTLALVCGAPEAGARVIGVDCGALGAHAGARATFRLGPSEERGALSFLAVARDEDEARAY